MLSCWYFHYDLKHGKKYNFSPMQSSLVFKSPNLRWLLVPTFVKICGISMTNVFIFNSLWFPIILEVVVLGGCLGFVVVVGVGLGAAWCGEEAGWWCPWWCNWGGGGGLIPWGCCGTTWWISWFPLMVLGILC